MILIRTVPPELLEAPSGDTVGMWFKIRQSRKKGLLYIYMD